MSLRHSILFRFGTQCRNTPGFVIPELVSSVALCIVSQDMGLPFRSAWVIETWIIGAIVVVICTDPLIAATKNHVVTFGKSIAVQWQPESSRSGNQDKPVTLKVRPLLLDGHVKEFTLGTTHDVTDRLFAVRRAFRVN